MYCLAAKQCEHVSCHYFLSGLIMSCMAIASKDVLTQSSIIPFGYICCLQMSLVSCTANGLLFVALFIQSQALPSLSGAASDSG